MKKSGEHLPLYPDEETIAIEVTGARRAKDWPEKARYLFTADFINSFVHGLLEQKLPVLPVYYTSTTSSKCCSSSRGPTAPF